MKGARTVRIVPFTDVGHYSWELPGWAAHEHVIDVYWHTDQGDVRVVPMQMGEIFATQDTMEAKCNGGVLGVPTACCVYDGALHFNIRAGYVGAFRIVTEDRA